MPELLEDFVSYSQPFKILLNPLRQFGGFLVQ
jgi:hypothetical protein